MGPSTEIITHPKISPSTTVITGSIRVCSLAIDSVISL